MIRTSILRSLALGTAVTLASVSCSSGTDKTTDPTNPEISLTLAPATLTVARNATGTVQLTVGRGGNYTGAVTFETANLPTGVTASFAPASLTSGTTSVLTLEVGATAPVGPATITVRAMGEGVTTKSATVTLTVSDGGTGADNVAWQFCSDARVPMWFAYRNGANGAWTRVTPGANNTFSFPINQAVGGVAYVVDEGFGAQVEVFYLTAAEMASVAEAECVTNLPAGKTIDGTVTGLGDGELANIGMGSVSAEHVDSDFQLTEVAEGPQNVLAVKGPVSETNFNIVPNRMLLVRNQNIPNNGTLPTLNFNDASSFAPATATISFTNAGEDEVYSFQSFVGANQVASPYLADFFAPSGSAITFHGVPTARLLAGELHDLLAMAVNEDGTESRMIQTYFREVTNKTFAFGPTLSAATITSSTSGGLARPRAQGTLQTVYDLSISATFTQMQQGRMITVTASRGYFGNGAAQYDLQTPDLAAVSGFNAAWGLLPGISTRADIAAIGAEGSAASQVVAKALRRDARRHAQSALNGTVASNQARVGANSSIPLTEIFAGLMLRIALLTLNFTT